MTSATQQFKPRQGSCLCGKVKYSITGKPFTTVVCHCINCQKVTGSAFAANALMKKENFKLVSGEDAIRRYTDKAVDSGNVLTRSFCGSCGSSLFLENSLGSMKDSIVVMTGTIDGPKDGFAPKRELFDHRKYPCVSIQRGAGKL